MNPKDILDTGLQSGFASQGTYNTVNRAGFQLSATHVVKDGGVYHDEYVTGGGNELARTVDGQAIIRTYAGDTISAEKLNQLGISEEEVLNFLKRIILEHANDTRFDQDFELLQGEWQYNYKVTYTSEDPYLITGIETIRYAGQQVFVHAFNISNVRES